MADTLNTSAPEQARSEPILALLRENDAQCMWQRSLARGPNKYTLVECYLVKTRLLILLQFTDADRNCTDGWDVFIPASTDSKVSTTLAAVRRYLETP